jgi:hypothetical protein
LDRKVLQRDASAGYGASANVPQVPQVHQSCVRTDLSTVRHWFHVARRIARIEKEFLYLPYGDDFQERLAAHWANLNSMKWMLWNDGVDMAEFGMTSVQIGIFQHALAHPEANGERFESIEAKLDELRSYLYANRKCSLPSLGWFRARIGRLSVTRGGRWRRCRGRC